MGGLDARSASAQAPSLASPAKLRGGFRRDGHGGEAAAHAAVKKGPLTRELPALPQHRPRDSDVRTIVKLEDASRPSKASVLPSSQLALKTMRPMPCPTTSESPPLAKTVDRNRSSASITEANVLDALGSVEAAKVAVQCKTEKGQTRSEAPDGSQHTVPSEFDEMMTEMFQKGMALDLAALQFITALLLGQGGGDSLQERPLALAGVGQKWEGEVLFREARPQPTRRYPSKRSKAQISKAQIDIWKPHGGSSTRRLVLPPSLQSPQPATPQEIVQRSGKIIRANGLPPLRYRQYELGPVGNKSKSKTGILIFHVLRDPLGFQGKWNHESSSAKKSRETKKQRTDSLPMQLPADDDIQSVTSILGGMATQQSSQCNSSPAQQECETNFERLVSVSVSLAAGHVQLDRGVGYHRAEPSRGLSVLL